MVDHRTVSQILGRRVSEVYVEVPPSPLSRRLASSAPKASPNKSQKENIYVAPLMAKSASSLSSLTQSTASESRKRTLSDAVNLPEKPAKVPKPDDDSVRACHQCGRKYVPEDEIRCTALKKTGKRCTFYYCRACLRRRYGDDIDNYNSSSTKKFKCPRCEDRCNCSRCRKEKGLPPLGLLNTKEPLQRKRIRPAATDSTEPSTSKSSGLAGKPRAIKSPPEPIWEEIDISLSREAIRDRIFIREFFQRFSELMEIAPKHINDLDDFESLSDTTCKALLVAVLDLVAADFETDQQKIVTSVLKDIRKGATQSPSKMWTCLESLRSALPSLLRFPDPCAPSKLLRSTRHATFVTEASQLIPVIVGLIEQSLQQPSVRAEISQGHDDGKEATRDHYAKVNEEKESWNGLKTALLDTRQEMEASPDWNIEKWQKEYRLKEDEHKQKLATLSRHHTVKMHSIASRYVSLGCDHDGREYYVLSYANGKKPATGEENRFSRWSWFLAVCKQGDSESSSSTDDDDESEVESDGYKWFGFDKPKDIRALAKWITWKVKVSPEGAVNEYLSGSKVLVKGLDEFATHLEWRLQ